MFFETALGLFVQHTERWPLPCGVCNLALHNLLNTHRTTEDNSHIDRSHSPSSSIHKPHVFTHSLSALTDRMMKIHAKQPQRLPSAACHHAVTRHDWLHLNIWQDRCNYRGVSVSSDSASGLDNSLGSGGNLRSLASQALLLTHTVQIQTTER